MAKRRANGEGSVYRRKDGLWVASVTIGYDNQGKQIRKVAYGKTRQDVLAKKQELLARYANVVYSDADKITVEQWMNKWLDTYAAQGVRQNTLDGYRAMTRLYIIPILGRHKLAKLTPVDIQTMVSKIAAEKSPRTTELAYVVLRAALNKAVDCDIISRSPCRGIELPRKRQKEFIPLTHEQWQALFDAAAHNVKMHTALVIIWATGITRSELLGLQWQDVDRRRGEINIVRGLTASSHGLVVAAPKATTRRRTIPVPPQVLTALDALRKHQLQEQLKAPIWHKSDFVFTRADGQPIDPRNFTHYFASVAKRAGVDVSLHKLRHDHATRLAAMPDVGIKDAQYRLGHATSRMLLDVYTHRQSGAQRQIADALADDLKKLSM